MRVCVCVAIFVQASTCGERIYSGWMYQRPTYAANMCSESRNALVRQVRMWQTKGHVLKKKRGDREKERMKGAASLAPKGSTITQTEKPWQNNACTALSLLSLTVSQTVRHKDVPATAGEIDLCPHTFTHCSLGSSPFLQTVSKTEMGDQ